jgi:aromatase
MTGRTDNAVVIGAPEELVWAMTNDIESWPSLFSEYATAEVLARDGNTVRFRLTTRPDENGTSWSWVSERTADPASRTVRARRIETGPFLDRMDIVWTYRQVDAGVEMRWIQDFDVAATSPVSEEQVAVHLNRQTAVELAHIKQQVESAAQTRGHASAS